MTRIIIKNARLEWKRVVNERNKKAANGAAKTDLK